MMVPCFHIHCANDTHMRPMNLISTTISFILSCKFEYSFDLFQTEGVT